MSIVETLAGLELEAGELLESSAGGETDFSEYADDPLGFIRDVLGETNPGPWRAQQEIARAVRDDPLVVVRSSNSMGKDWLAGRLALWWTYARRGLVLVTGPTERQVREIVMTEVRRAFNKAKGLHGDLFQMALRVGEDEQRGILAFTSSAASNLTGFHGPRILVILTEAQGVEEFAWEGMLACATGPEDRFLALGNPLQPSGRFYVASRSSNWNSIQVSALEHPNVATGETIIPGAVSQAFVDRIASEYGRNSPQFKSRVLGECPAQGAHSLFSREWIDAAFDRWRNPDWPPESVPRSSELVVSVDPARYGPDASVAVVRRGPVVEAIHSWHGRDTAETAARVGEIAWKAGVRPGLGKYQRVGVVRVDEIGLGAGVLDQIKARPLPCEGFNSSSGARERGRFVNRRAEAYWHLRELLEDGKIALKPDEQLADELLATDWEPAPDGRIRLPAKESVRATLGRSPDRADAAVMAFEPREQGIRFATFRV